ncbi:hypothetical protein SGLAM104S_06931 [Streptomyces glaucescens]
MLDRQVDARERQPDRGGGGDGEPGERRGQVGGGDVHGGGALAGVAGGVGLRLDVLAGVDDLAVQHEDPELVTAAVGRKLPASRDSSQSVPRSA